MGRGGHEVPKVSPGPAMPDPSTPYGQATAETASWPFLEWSARRDCSRRPLSILLDAPRMPMVKMKEEFLTPQPWNPR
jgi:hypothetical protein